MREKRFCRDTILAATAGALALTLAVPAIADEYGREGGTYYTNGNEEIVVHAPRHRYHMQTPDIPGTPIRDVAISREVRFDDLDLRSRWGARMLRARVEATARALCQRMDAMYPVKTDNSPPCFRTAFDDAMMQVDEAIAQERDESE